MDYFAPKIYLNNSSLVLYSGCILSQHRGWNVTLRIISSGIVSFRRSNAFLPHENRKCAKTSFESIFWKSEIQLGNQGFLTFYSIKNASEKILLRRSFIFSQKLRVRFFNLAFKKSHFTDEVIARNKSNNSKFRILDTSLFRSQS